MKKKVFRKKEEKFRVLIVSEKRPEILTRQKVWL